MYALAHSDPYNRSHTMHVHALVTVKRYTLVTVQDIESNFSHLTLHFFVHIITLADYTVMILCFYPPISYTDWYGFRISISLHLGDCSGKKMIARDNVDAEFPWYNKAC